MSTQGPTIHLKGLKIGSTSKAAVCSSSIMLPSSHPSQEITTVLNIVFHSVSSILRSWGEGSRTISSQTHKSQSLHFLAYIIHYCGYVTFCFFLITQVTCVVNEIDIMKIYRAKCASLDPWLPYPPPPTICQWQSFKINRVCIFLCPLVYMQPLYVHNHK